MNHKDNFLNDFITVVEPSDELLALVDAMPDMAPALFTVGAPDPFLDDSIIMATNWLMAGNEARLVIYRKAPHGFDMMPSPEQRHQEKVIRVFMERCFH